MKQIMSQKPPAWKLAGMTHINPLIKMKQYHLKSTLLFYTIGVSVSLQASEKMAKKPNFVWFMVEDVSKHYLKLYNLDGKGAVTPHVEMLAQEGVVFNHAFCNAPVSSAARSTLFTGSYAPRTGMSWHRKLKTVPMPEGLAMFPAYLKEAGYFTANSSKTDYNCIMPDGTWDREKGGLDEWKKRPQKEMPFFFVRTNSLSHESCLHFPSDAISKKKTKYDPQQVKVAPFHPDTELFRYTYATFYDRIANTDAELGTLMQELSDEEVLDDTFIFYFGDNGGSLPGTKGYTGELGLHVPLVVYIPKNWRDKLDIPIGGNVDGFVSFMDFAPTLLHLADLDVPEQMDGAPFLGKDIPLQLLNKRDHTFGYGDRFDELYAFTRTVRIGKYKYSRNFIPYQPKGFYAFYRYKMEAFKEWKQLYEAGILTDVQAAFFKPQLPEELYDIEKDPFETDNLANDSAYMSTLRKLRTALKENMIEKRDLGLFPEAIWLADGATDPVTFGIKSQKQLARYSDLTDLELRPFKEAKGRLQKALKSDDPIDRYWAITVCISFGQKAESLKTEISGLLHDASILVKSRSILFLAVLGELKPEKLMTDILESAHTEAEILQILGDMAYMSDYIPNIRFQIDAGRLSCTSENITWRLIHLHSHPSKK